MRIAFSKRATIVALTLGSMALAGCGTIGKSSGVRLTSRECMARVMYFESNRSSDDGMLAVGTVVMNRMNSGRYPRTVCGVVGQPVQFAPGVLTKPMRDSGRPRAFRMADAVLSGARHPTVGSRSMFFHTAGYKFPYRNMHYVAIAGGNSFYEKRKAQPGVMLARQEDVAERQQLAWMGERRQPVPRATLAEPVERRTYEPVERRVASLEPRPSRRPVESDIPVYEQPLTRSAAPKPAPYGYDAARGGFEERPGSRDEDPGSYGYVDRAARSDERHVAVYEPRQEAAPNDGYDAAPSPRAPEIRYERPVASERRAEWGEGGDVRRPRRIDPAEPMVIASAAGTLREPRPEAQAPRSIEELIEGRYEAPRPRRPAPRRVVAAPVYDATPVYVPD